MDGSFNALYVSKLRLLMLVSLLGFAGCASVQAPQRDHLNAADRQVAECAEWFGDLDSAVAQSDVADIAARRLAGFPYLRIDRFLAAMKPAATGDPQVWQAWLDELRARDIDGRRVEIANLPSAQIADLAAGDRGAVELRTQECAERLMAADLSNATAIDALQRRAFVADDYSSLKRAFGLYEFTRLPFSSGVQGWQNRTVQSFDRARGGEQLSQQRQRYLPEDMPAYSRREVSAILARSAQHPLGLPQLSAAERERLFGTYAPVFEIETSGDFDRIGRLIWSSAAAPQVDVSQPVVYRRLGYTRFAGRTLLQLVFVAWFAERPGQGSFDVLSGHLDGVVWRVTLAADGEPLLFDSIHPCGCYHLFFPTPRLEPLPPPQAGIEWAFSPVTLPAVAESERLVVALRTGSHYLRNVSTNRASAGVTYKFVDYDELRSLPLPLGGSRSVFGPDGLIAGTERGERFLFWPMGIASPGAMRQAGTQATAFIGRRHFDDADLVEKRFRLRY